MQKLQSKKIILPENIMPNIFRPKKESILIRDKKLLGVKVKVKVNKPKHFPSNSIEWNNSIYSYNENNIKLLPILQKNVYNIVKSYFNMFAKIRFINRKLMTGKKLIRATIKRPFISKPTLKFTSDRVILTVMSYNCVNRTLKRYIKSGKTIDNVRNTAKKWKTVFTKLNNKTWTQAIEEPYFIDEACGDIINDYYKKSLRNKFYTTKLLQDIKDIIKTRYLRVYFGKRMEKEIDSIRCRQKLSFNRSKHQQRYIHILAEMIQRIYRKKVTFDIINIKTYFNSSNIFAHIVSYGLRGKIGIYKHLRNNLKKFKVPFIDRVKFYNDKYMIKQFKNNITLKEIINNTKLLGNNKNVDNVTDITLKNYITNCSSTSLYDNEQLDTNINNVINSLKNTAVKGIRIEAAGRLTKRNTASRSVFAAKYKGNIKDIESSVKALPSVLLRGHARPNLVYSSYPSKRRTGAFAVKTWISAN